MSFRMSHTNFGIKKYHVKLIQIPQKPNNVINNDSISKISLLSINLDFLPKLFIITTNNGSYRFNVDILKDISKTISNQLEKEPNNLEFHIDINDDENIMKKIEDVFGGLAVEFKFAEILPVRNIIQILGIDNCPIYFKNDIKNVNYYQVPSKIEIEIDKQPLITFLKSKYPQVFTIKTNKNVYKCTELGILSSKVIRDLKNQNPEMTEYFYNYDDNNNEFQTISALFNFNYITITAKNMNSLKLISDELQIDPLIKTVDQYISSYKNSVHLIDDKKVIIETIDELFHLLYNIKTLTVDAVKKSILETVWVKTEENVQELVACIMQVVRVGYTLQPYLIELVASLNNSQNDQNELKFFLPFLVNQFKQNFSITPFYSSFYYKLAQSGIIDMNETVDHVNHFLIEKDELPKENSIYNSLLFFFPELFEKNKNKSEFQKIQINDNNATFFRSFIPFKINQYKKLRDNCEPQNELAKSIYDDDLESLKTIILEQKIGVNDLKIQPGPFDVFSFKSPISLVDYSAMHGSINCFNFLISNRAEVTKQTFVLAVYGGNKEIVKTVDEKTADIFEKSDNKKDDENQRKMGFFDQDQLPKSFDKRNFIFNLDYDSFYLNNCLSTSIMKHDNELFDWILKEKVDKENLSNLLIEVAYIAVQCGNAHAFISCIDQGLEFSSNQNKKLIGLLLNEACHYGFYRILQLITSLSKDVVLQANLQILQFFWFGNKNIYKIMIENDVYVHIEKISGHPLILTIERFYDSFFCYIIESGDFVPQNQSVLMSFYMAAIANKNTVIYNFLKENYPFYKIIKMSKTWREDSFNYDLLLEESCECGFVEAAKDLIEFIHSMDSDADFTDSFYLSILSKNEEIYKFMLNKKVNIKVKPNDHNLKAITLIDIDLALFLIDKIDIDFKEETLNQIFDLAVLNGNKELVKILLENGCRLECTTLIDAVQSSCIDVVDLILKVNSSPSFVNYVHLEGSALSIAVRNNETEIVKLLLSIPGIDLNSYDKENCTPLMVAIKELNVEMIDLIVKFYGDQIQSQSWQIRKGIKFLLDLFYDPETSEANSKSKNYSDMIRKRRKNRKKVAFFDDADESYDEYEENEDDYLPKIVNLIDKKSTFIIKNGERMLDAMSHILCIEKVDLKCHFSYCSVLSYACEVGDAELVKLLLKSDRFDVNEYFAQTGNTPLMISIENSNIEIAKLLIENDQTDLNHRNFDNQTALTIASQKGLETVVNLLISSPKIDLKKSQLTEAYFISKEKVSNVLLSIKEFDVNTSIEMKDYIELLTLRESKESNKNVTFTFSEVLDIPYVTPLIKSIVEKQDETLDAIISHPSFDKQKSKFVDCLFASVFMDKIDVFKKLLKLFECDVNVHMRNGSSLLLFSIFVTSSSIMTEILNNESFDSKKSDILSAFVKAGLFIPTADTFGQSRVKKSSNSNSVTFRPFVSPCFGLKTASAANRTPSNSHSHQTARIQQMEELFEYDKKHSNLIKLNEFLPNGKTFFTSINPRVKNIKDVVDFLNAKMADPNLPNREGVTPIEYAIRSNSIDLVRSILSIEKVDLTVRSKGEFYDFTKGDTILHMAVRSSMDDVLEEVLKKDAVDVNSENDEGETCLMVACKLKKLYFARILFDRKDLDYTRRNKDGHDAIEIIENEIKQNNGPNFKNPCLKIRNIMSRSTVNDIRPEEKREYFKKLMKLI